MGTRHRRRRRVARLVHVVERRARQHACVVPTYVRGAASYRIARQAVDAGLLVAAASKTSLGSSVPRELALYPAWARAEAWRAYRTLMPKRARPRRSS